MKTLNKVSIVGNTHYGLKIYARVLQHYYPGETVLSLSGRDCKPSKNPFNQDKPTLHIQIVNNVAVHEDLEDAIPSGDVFDFASRHYQLADDALLEFLNTEMNLGLVKNLAILEEHYSNEVPERKPKPIHYPSFSFFQAPVTNTIPGDTASLLEIYQLLKDDCYKQKTNELRSIQDKKAARKFKAAGFDYVTFSGTFSKRSDEALIRHSGLITIDFDHIGNIAELRTKLLQDEYFETELLFVSPSGDGIKWIIPIDISKATHQDYFRAIASYIKQTYGLDIDQSGKDVSRACFIAHDAEAFINPKYI
ncbi:MAG: hypothetical protein KF825_13770 [Ferruginibacter sp.]|nr:hypothetical protein [Ferruginibacter sp.]